MRFSRKGSERNEGMLHTNGHVARVRYRSSERAIVAALDSVPNFNNGTGTHDWEVGVSVAEFGQLANALALEANGRYRRSIARDLRQHLDALRVLIDACEPLKDKGEKDDPG